MAYRLKTYLLKVCCFIKMSVFFSVLYTLLTLFELINSLQILGKAKLKMTYNVFCFF